MSNNMFQTTNVISEDEENVAVQITNNKLEQKVFPRFVVITALLLKSFKEFQKKKDSRMLSIFIQILDGCQHQPFDENTRQLFQRFIQDLKNIRNDHIDYRYIIQQLQSEIFTFTLSVVANIVYCNHDAQQYLYGPSLISCFQDLKLEIYFSPQEIQPNFIPLVIKQLEYNSFGVIF
ncbi:hypothetical protein ABPG74_016742 [Tetrahymena malaccensis]